MLLIFTQSHTPFLYSPNFTISNFFFLNDPATPEIYPLPHHDALPISQRGRDLVEVRHAGGQDDPQAAPGRGEEERPVRELAGAELEPAHPEPYQEVERFEIERARHERSEEHTSELQSPDHLVCRLLLE